MKALYALLLSVAVTQAAMTTSWVTNADKSISLVVSNETATWLVVGTVESVSGASETGLPAPTISGVEITGTNHSSAGFAWDTDIATAPNYVDLGTVDGAYGITGTAGDGKYHSLTVPGLLPSTTYQYRVRSYGNGQWSTNTPAWFATPAAPTAGDNTLTNGLLAWWSLDDATYPDSSGNGYTLTKVGNISSVAGVQGNAISSAGNNANYLQRADADVWDPMTNAMTFVCWFRMVDTNASSGLMSKYNPTGSKAYQIVWSKNFSSLYAAVVTNTPTSGSDFTASEVKTPTNNWAVNRWYFVATIFDPVSEHRTRICYGDDAGALSQWYYSENYAGWGTDGTGRNTTEPFRIGVSGLTMSAMRGYIDEVSVYRRALTDDEVMDLYNDGIGQSYPPQNIP